MGQRVVGLVTIAWHPASLPEPTRPVMWSEERVHSGPFATLGKT